MAHWYFLAFLFVIFSVNDCNELNETHHENVVKLPHFAQDFVQYISNLRTRRNLFSEQGNADEYVDRLFTGLRQYLAKHYEPLKKENVAPEVKSIYFEGLSTIVRVGSVTVRGDELYTFVSAHLGFHKFKGNAAFEKQLWWLFWISGVANIDVRGIEFYFSLRVHLNNDKLKLRLETLDIKDWGHMDTSLEGSNWIGSAAGFVTNLFPSLILNWIKNNVPSLLYNGINDALRDMVFSLNGINIPLNSNSIN